MRSRFEPDADVIARPESTLVDPEACDSSEQQFAASLEVKPGECPRFVIEEADGTTGAALPPVETVASGEVAGDEPHPEQLTGRWRGEEEQASAIAATQQASAIQPDLLEEQDLGTWRQEVAARLNHYRTRRRPRAPRYPSLRLKFEESVWSAPARPEASQASAHVTEQALALETQPPVAAGSASYAQPLVPAAPPAEIGRLLEFPRSAMAAPSPRDELAEAVIDRPRILEAPELAPPLPALGGILIETLEEPSPERRPGFEIPLQSAPMSRRLLASSIDAILVLSAFTLFAYIFLRITSTVPPLQQAATASAGLIGALWAGYQYLMLVHAGTTLGLKLARLDLSRFDGSPVPRAVRRWRVLVSVLSGVSLGLGYAWCFLDEDALCWHDRITRTYAAPRATT